VLIGDLHDAELAIATGALVRALISRITARRFSMAGLDPKGRATAIEVESEGVSHHL